MPSLLQITLDGRSQGRMPGQTQIVIAGKINKLAPINLYTGGHALIYQPGLPVEALMPQISQGLFQPES